MIQLILRAIVLLIAIGIARRVSDILGIAIEPRSFGVGLVVALLAAFFLFLFDGWWSTVTRPRRPQEIRLQTKETPAQITNASCRAVVYGILALFFGAIVVKVLLFQ